MPGRHANAVTERTLAIGVNAMEWLQWEVTATFLICLAIESDVVQFSFSSQISSLQIFYLFFFNFHISIQSFKQSNPSSDGYIVDTFALPLTCCETFYDVVVV